MDKGCCPLLLLFLSYSSFERLSLHPILSQPTEAVVCLCRFYWFHLKSILLDSIKKKKSWDISIRHQNDKAATVVLLKFPIWLVHINTHWTFWLLDSWFSNARHSFTWWFFGGFFAARVAFPHSWHWKPGSGPIHLVRNPAALLTVGPAQTLRKDIYHNCCSEAALVVTERKLLLFSFQQFYNFVCMLTCHSLSEPVSTWWTCLGSSCKNNSKKQITLKTNN